MSDKEPENNGAEATGPAAARPTGKRQLAGVSTTSTSVAEAAKARKSDDEDSKGGSVTRFFPEMVEEIRKVVWPTGKQMLQYTIIVFAFLIVMTALVAGVDFLAGMGVETVLTN